MKNIIKNTIIFIVVLFGGIMKATAQEPVVWVNKVGVTVEGDNSIVKTSQLNNKYDAGAATANVIPGNEDGWFEVVPGSINTSRFFGLTSENRSIDQTDIDFAFNLLSPSGRLYIYENGLSRGQFGTFSSTDVLRIERTGTAIQYKKNGVLLYTSTRQSTTSLIGDVSISTMGGQLTQASMSVGVNLSNIPTAAASNVLVQNIGDNQVDVSWTNGNGEKRTVIVHRGDSFSTFPENGTTIYSANEHFGLGQQLGEQYYAVLDSDNSSPSGFTLKGLLPGVTYQLAVVEYNMEPGKASNFLADISSVVSFKTTGDLLAEHPVIWKDLVGMELQDNHLVKTSTNAVWGNSGAYSTNRIPEDSDGRVDMIVDRTNLGRVFGLSNKNVNDHFDAFDYGIYLQNNAQFRAHEGGVNHGDLYALQTGDTLSLARVNGVVYYLHNGKIFDVAEKTSDEPLSLDVALFTQGALSTDEFTMSALPADSPATEPTLKASNFIVDQIGTHKLNLSWTNGNGERRIIIGSTSPITEVPIDGYLYRESSTIFGQGSLLDNSTTVIYNGSDDTNVSVSGLRESSDYYFAIFEYNEEEGLISNYLTSDYPLVSATTQSSGGNSQDIVWTDLIGVDTTGNTLTSNSLGWNTAGAASLDSIAIMSNGWVEIEAPETATNLMFGFSMSNTNAHFTSIEYSLQLSNSSLRIYEKGIYRGNF